MLLLFALLYKLKCTLRFGNVRSAGADAEQYSGSGILFTICLLDGAAVFIIISAGKVSNNIIDEGEVSNYPLHLAFRIGDTNFFINKKRHYNSLNLKVILNDTKC